MMNMDAEIAEKVMGWKEYTPNDPPFPPKEKWWRGPAKNPKHDVLYCAVESWTPTTDISQAFQVVKKMRLDGYDYQINYNQGDVGDVEFWIQLVSGSMENYGCANFKHENNLPAAICKAALSAIRGEQ